MELRLQNSTEEEFTGKESDKTPLDSNDGAYLYRLYLKEVRKYSVLSSEKEKDLEFDPDGREKLVLHNLRLVISIARTYNHNPCGYINILDLIQEGNIGLQKAAEKFDFAEGYRFSTYATWWIRQVITRSIADFSRTVRLPIHIQERINQYEKTAEELIQKFGRPPTSEEIAASLGVKLREIKNLEKTMYAREVSSLDAPFDDKLPLSEVIPSSLITAEEVAIDNCVAERIQEAIEGLKKTKSGLKKAFILTRRLGLDSQEPEALDSIGKSPEWVIINSGKSVSRERIRQIEKKAKEYIRRRLKSRFVHD